MSLENNNYHEPIINHVPTQKELENGNKPVSGERLSADEMRDLRLSLGYDVTERPQPVSGLGSLAKQTSGGDRPLPVGPPNIEPPINQTMTPKSLKQLRSELNTQSPEE